MGRGRRDSGAVVRLRLGGLDGKRGKTRDGCRWGRW
jgi:hypothetical protein